MPTRGNQPDLPSLADALLSYRRLAQRMRGRTPLLLLDYDGTLTPIADRPELAVLPEPTRAALRDLATLCPVAIVSGRDRADVARLVAIDSLIYAGSHGFDISGPGGLRMEHGSAAALEPVLDRADARLRSGLKDAPGILVERKRFAIAVHYRLAPPETVPAAKAAIDAAVADSDGRLRRAGGKKLFELRPTVAWDKGRAVLWLLDTLDRHRTRNRIQNPDQIRESSTLAIYLGDDETDEDAFTALRPIGGIGILVAPSPRPTAAHYRLENPDAVTDLLRRLAWTLKQTR